MFFCFFKNHKHNNNNNKTTIYRNYDNNKLENLRLVAFNGRFLHFQWVGGGGGVAGVLHFLNQTQMIDGGHDVVDFSVPYGMEQLLDGHRSVIGRRVLLLLLLKHSRSGGRGGHGGSDGRD